MAISAGSDSLKSAEGLSIESNSILKLDLNYEINERVTTEPMSFNFDKPKLGLKEILASIKAAKSDDKIKGIYIPLGMGIQCGYATIEAIRNELIDFKKANKFVIAYDEVGTQKSYYLASVADNIYLNPKGGIDFRGFGGQMMFLKGMLDKLEIKTQIYYAGKFKSATEPLRYDKMSDPNKQQMTEYLSDFSSIIMQNISTARNIPLNRLSELTDSMMLSNPEDAVAYHFVDGLKYQDEVEGILKKESGIAADQDIKLVSLNNYFDAVSNDAEPKTSKIAVVIAEGDIVDGKGDRNNIGSSRYAKVFKDLRENNDIKAVVLRINSGGGSALASDVMWRELELLKAKKPVVVSMGDVAASGGYYIAANAKQIFAQPNTITGSIGVFGVIPNMQDFFKNKLGITYDEVEINQHAVLGVNKPFDEYEAQFFQKRVDQIYMDFKQVVAAGRKRDIEYIDSIAQGRVWSGTKAMQIGLVDQLGGLDAAIAFACKEAKIEVESPEYFPKHKEGIEAILESFSEASLRQMMYSYLLKDESKLQLKTLREINAMRDLQGIRMSLPFILNIY
ncbi:MAG: signal peptide peptidase SppA [Bacteroidetes bacterium]|nr:signal peptide peptidase SppA [Bacteroidota bacterium]